MKKPMNMRVGTLLICSALMMSTAVVQAQDRNHHDRDQQGHGQRDNHNRHDQRGHGMYDRGRSEGWYRRGGHVPSEYRGNTYIVNDWRGQHLHQPPRGYHYVRSDNGDFLLVAITTGVIASILAHH